LVKLADLNLSGPRFALRIIGGIFFAAVVLFIFYYLPSHLTELVSPYLSSQYIPYLNEITSAIVSPGIPFLGILLAVITFFDVLLRGSWTYGIILIVTGVLYLAYDYLLFLGGQLLISDYPTNVTQSPIYQQVLPILYALVIILILSTLLSIGRGVYLIVKGNRKTSGNIQQQQEASSGAR